MGLDNLVGVNLEKVAPDALRKQRNVADYSGDVVPPSAVKECVAQAKALLVAVRQWLQINRPDLLG